MSRRTVIIPLVGHGGVGGELLELYGEPSPDPGKDEDERKRGIEPVVEALRPINLYMSGQRALAAIQKLLDDKAKRIFNLDHHKIRYSNRPASSIEGESAQLGIALLLLMSGGQSDIRSVIATGRLEVLPGQLDFDAHVEPVNSLDKKLSLILEAKQRDQLNPEITKALIPVSRMDGEGTFIDIATQRAALAKVGIEVIPVRTLKEAARHLNIKLVGRPFAARHVVMASVLLAGASVVGFWSWIVNQNIPVRFEAEPMAGIPDKPFIVCPHARSDFAGYEPISLDGMKPQAPVAGTLGWRIRLGELAALDTRWFDWLHRAAGYEGYHVAVAFVGERSGLHILATEGGATQIRKLLGAVWGWRQQLDEQAEAGALVFLVQRFNRFELDTLRARFQERFAGTGQDGNASIHLNLATDFLATQAAGSLRYFFESVDKPSPCRASLSTPRSP